MAGRRSDLLWDPVEESMSTSDLRDLQLAKLKTQLLRVDALSAFHRRRFRAAGVDPKDLRSLHDFTHFPVFDKLEERTSQAVSLAELGHPFGEHIVCSPTDVVRVSASSGTTGVPTYQGYTERDRRIANTLAARIMWRTGARPGEVVMHAFVLSMWIAGWPILDALQSFGATVVPIGAEGGATRFGVAAQNLKPAQVDFTPSYAEYLLRKLPDAGIDPASLGIKRLLLGGEPGAGIPHVRERISAGFGNSAVYDAIGVTNAAFLCAVSCPQYQGMHFVGADYIYPELLDPESLQPLAWEDGAEGELVYTALEKECAPGIRWREKDHVRVHTRPCGCGRPGFRFEILGRTDDMLLVRGVNVFPHAIKDVVTSFAPRVTGSIRVVLDGPPPLAPSPLPILVESDRGLDPRQAEVLGRQIEERIHHLLRFRAQVQVVPASEFIEQVGTTFKAQLTMQRDKGRPGPPG